MIGFILGIVFGFGLFYSLVVLVNRLERPKRQYIKKQYKLISDLIDTAKHYQKLGFIEEAEEYLSAAELKSQELKEWQQENYSL